MGAGLGLLLLIAGLLYWGLKVITAKDNEKEKDKKKKKKK